MEKKYITNEEVAEIAKKHGIKPASLLAVKQVESGGRPGFESNGDPQILFEGHIFYRLLSKNRKDLNVKELAQRHPNIIYPTWTRTRYLGGIKEWSRLETAKIIDERLANMSASWGMFQIMGFNYKSCGCTSIEVFVNKMCDSVESQIELTIQFMRKNNMISLLNTNQWEEFAKKYNGPGYKANNYDVKLATWALRFSEKF